MTGIAIYKETGTPSAPATGIYLLYQKGDGNLYFKDELGKEYAVLNAANLPATQQTLVDAATITWDMSAGICARVALGGNRTLAFPTNVAAGTSGFLDVIQDSTGSRTLTFASGYLHPFGTAPVLSTTGGARDRFYWSTWDTTHMDMVMAKGMA